MNADKTSNDKANPYPVVVSLATVLVAITGIILQPYLQVAQFLAIVITCGIVVFVMIALPKQIRRHVADNLNELDGKLSKDLQIASENREEITRVENSLSDLWVELIEGSPERMSWSRFWGTVRRLQDIIQADGSFRPDIVLSVGRSGSIVGSLIAGNMGCIHHIGIDRIDRWSREGGVYSRTVEIIPNLRIFTSFLEHKNVLCIMPECNTGRTLDTLIRELRTLSNLGTIKTGVLYRNVNTFFRPDYVAVEDSGKRPNFPFRTSVWKDDSKSPNE